MKIDLVAVGKTVAAFSYAPFLRHLKAVGTVETKAVVVIPLALPPYRDLNDALRAMKELPDHTLLLDGETILPWEYTGQLLGLISYLLAKSLHTLKRLLSHFASLQGHPGGYYRQETTAIGKNSAILGPFLTVSCR